MFKATVVASELRKQMAYYFDLIRGNEIVQVIHRGSSIKVVMTQEHYLNLLSRLALYEKSADAKTVPAKSLKELESLVKAKLQQHEHEDELQDDTSPVGQKRVRQA